ncbi:MAG: TonB-dependent receptor [Gammaproteobacteria bacterium]|nr:TonB-dependent receptor [Gammaproteobacteria bacterium]
MTRHAPFWFCLIACGLAPALAAEERSVFDLSLEELSDVAVTTASRYAEDRRFAPSAIAVLEAEDIARFGALNLAQALERVAGLYFTGSHFFPQNVSALRGDWLTHADNHVLLLVNGHPVRESYSGGINFPIYLAFPLAALQRIEVARGPGSVLYGANAYSGIINLITADAGEMPDEATLLAGELGGRGAALSGGGLWGELELSAAVQGFREKGWNFHALDSNRRAGSIDYGEDNLGLYAQARWRDWRLEALRLDSRQDFLGASTAWTGAPPPEARDVRGERDFLALSRRFDQAEGWWLDAHASLGRMDFDHYNYRAHARDGLVELTQHWRPGEAWHWLAGLAWWDQRYGSSPGLQPAPVPETRLDRQTLFLQGDWFVLPELKLTAGLQHNRGERGGKRTLPRAALAWQFAETAGLKLMHAEAYRVAYGVETDFRTILKNPDGTIRGGLRGNPALEPERISTTDLQLYWQDDGARLALTLFRSKESELITRVRAPDRVIDFVNLGELRFRGAELEGDWPLGEDATLTGSWTEQRNEHADGRERFSPVPERLIKLGLEVPLAPSLRLGLFAQHIGQAGDIAVRNPSRLAVNPEAGAYTLLSAQLRWKPEHGLGILPAGSELALYGDNLLGEDVHQPEIAGQAINTIPARAGRSLYLGLRLPLD